MRHWDKEVYRIPDTDSFHATHHTYISPQPLLGFPSFPFYCQSTSLCSYAYSRITTLDFHYAQPHTYISHIEEDANILFPRTCSSVPSFQFSKRQQTDQICRRELGIVTSCVQPNKSRARASPYSFSYIVTVTNPYPKAIYTYCMQLNLCTHTHRYIYVYPQRVVQTGPGSILSLSRHTTKAFYFDVSVCERYGICTWLT